jgi:DNA-binding MarR family transcriptional regulator
MIHEPARMIIMAQLYVVDSADFLFLANQTGMTAGNLSSHLSKLEDAGYVEIIKEFLDRKPHTMLRLTAKGRMAFKEYRENMKTVIENLPEK